MCKGRNSAVQSIHLRWTGQYKKCVQYNFKCTSDNSDGAGKHRCKVYGRYGMTQFVFETRSVPLIKNNSFVVVINKSLTARPFPA